MITFNVKNQLEVSLPTSMKEITNEYLNEVTKEINLADDMSLIGLVSVSTLNDLMFSSKTKKNGATVAIVPIFIKSGNTDCRYIKNINTGDKLILSRTAIELGDHVRFTNNSITCNNVMHYLEIDDNLRHSLLDMSFYKEHNIVGTPKVYMLDFKLVPNNDIHGAYVNIDDFENPFVKSLKA